MSGREPPPCPEPEGVRAGGAPGGELTGSHERLAELRQRERETGDLRRRESELEVGGIAAAAALRAGPPAGTGRLDPAAAAALGEQLVRMGELRRALDEAGGAVDGDPSEARRHRERGRDALIAWLGAPHAGTTLPAPATARWILLAVCLAVIAAAVTVHAILLLLLVPVAGATSLLWWTRQDTLWTRMGCRKRFEETGLAPPDAWEDAAVRRRLSELEAAIEGAVPAVSGFAPDPELPGGDPASLARALSGTRTRLDRALAEAGLGPGALEARIERWLIRLAEAERARRDLAELKSRRRHAAAEAEQLRNRVFRFLAEHGAAPDDGHADTRTLGERLGRVARSAPAEEGPRGGGAGAAPGPSKKPRAPR